MAGKTTPRERLAALLKQRGSQPEIRAFRDQARDVFRQGGPWGLDAWIEARRELGLITDPLVERAASDLQSAVGRVIDEATMNPSPAAPVSMSWEEKLARLNERETKSRQNIPPVGYRPPPHRKPKPAPKPKPRAQRQRPLSPTNSSDPKPLSLLQRMALAWDRLSPKERRGGHE